MMMTNHATVELTRNRPIRPLEASSSITTKPKRSIDVWDIWINDDVNECGPIMLMHSHSVVSRSSTG